MRKYEVGVGSLTPNHYKNPVVLLFFSIFRLFLHILCSKYDDLGVRTIFWSNSIFDPNQQFIILKQECKYKITFKDDQSKNS